MTRTKATAIGFSAVLLWALLALLTVGSAPVPPLQLNAMAFGLGGLVGLVWTLRNRRFHVLVQVKWPVHAFGTAGLFGYHFLYFSALRSAPPAEAGLIAYLWPLLIVLFSGMLPGERLRTGHVAGAFIALAGAAMLFSGGISGFQAENLPGFAFAGAAALTWATYSVGSRRLGHVPTESVTVFCLATAALSLATHLALEETAWPQDAAGWGAIAALGLGPVGLAFYLWDVGVKRGNIQLLGVASYAAPVLSTLTLVLAGITPPSWSLFLAALLIAGGALLAARASGAGGGDQA